MAGGSDREMSLAGKERESISYIWHSLGPLDMNLRNYGCCFPRTTA